MSDVKKSQIEKSVAITSAELIKQTKARIEAKKKELDEKQVKFEEGLDTVDGIPVELLNMTKYLNGLIDHYNKDLKGKIFPPTSFMDKAQKEYERLIKKKQDELDQKVKDLVSTF
jgi:Skp family chaperone for outer membrane proteins